MYSIFKNTEENVNIMKREMQDRNKIPCNSFLCLLQLNNPPPEMKNSLNRHNSRLNTAENKTNKFKDTAIDTIQIKVRQKKDGKRINQASVIYGT